MATLQIRPATDFFPTTPRTSLLFSMVMLMLLTNLKLSRCSHHFTSLSDTQRSSFTCTEISSWRGILHPLVRKMYTLKGTVLYSMTKTIIDLFVFDLALQLKVYLKQNQSISVFY